MKKILFCLLGIYLLTINLCLAKDCSLELISELSKAHKAELLECRIVKNLLHNNETFVFLLYHFQEVIGEDAGITVKIYKYNSTNQKAENILFSLSGLGSKLQNFSYQSFSTKLAIDDINGDGKIDWAIRTANFRTSALMIYTYNSSDDRFESIGGSYYFGLDEKMKYKDSFISALDGKISIENKIISLESTRSITIYELGPDHNYTLKSDKKK